MSSINNIRRAESPTKPELVDLASLASSTSSMSRGSTDTPVENEFRSFGSNSLDDKDDPILNGRSEAGASEWSLEQQEEFIAHLLLHTEGKRFTDAEIQLIRSEVVQVGLPAECVDRLIEQHKMQQQLQEESLKKHTSEAYEIIEDVDESDNIQAYFSRMATLKQGGHFPSLNTEAIQEFVEEDSCTEDIEVDLDVGFVNKSLDLSIDEDVIRQGESWAESDNDERSQASSAFDFRNAYNTIHAFESMLVKGANEGDAEEEDLTSVDRNPKMIDQLEMASTQTEEDDWAPQVARPTRTRTYRYGDEHDLAEWKRKSNIALWKPSSSGQSSFFTCTAMAESVVADELSGLLLGVKKPPRLHGMTAVKKLLNEVGERRQRQRNRNHHRHVPDEVASAPKPWNLSYRERCRPSQGYIGVDVYSLMDSAAAIQPLDSRDNSLWESRDVRQHFLHERSISLSRNWFGRLRRKRGNDPNTYRPCRPNTMGMPTEPSSQATSSNFDDCEWTDAPSRTTTSKSVKSRSGHSEVNRTVSLSFSSGEPSCQSPSHTYDDESSSRSHSARDCSSSSESHDDDDTSGFHSRGNGKKKMQVDFGSMMTSLMMSGSDAHSHSNLRGDGYGIPWMSEDEFDDTDRFGVGAILGHHEDHNNISSFSETFSGSHSSDSSDDGSSTASSGSFVTDDSVSTSSGSDGSWEDARECGTLVNVKPKLGERVSRVTPDHTSHLLRSRFRKKYCPKGI